MHGPGERLTPGPIKSVSIKSHRIPTSRIRPRQISRRCFQSIRRKPITTAAGLDSVRGRATITISTLPTATAEMGTIKRHRPHRAGRERAKQHDACSARCCGFMSIQRPGHTRFLRTIRSSPIHANAETGNLAARSAQSVSRQFRSRDGSHDDWRRWPGHAGGN